MSDYNKFLFGSTLKKLRLENGLNQQQLANKIGVSQNAISQWENGVREPDNIQLFINLATILNVSLDTLVNSNLNDVLFSNAHEATEFILRQPMVANFGGYDLDVMSDEEIIEMAEEVAEMLQVMAKRHRKK